jgi:hypothetical protein
MDVAHPVSLLARAYRREGLLGVQP